jgi:hypothetical protein
MSDENPKQLDNPLWETVAMAGSFVMLWAWMLARMAATQRAAQSRVADPSTAYFLSPLWTVVQIAAVAILLVILVRRVKRARKAMQELTIGFGPPTFGGGPQKPIVARLAQAAPSATVDSEAAHISDD